MTEVVSPGSGLLHDLPACPYKGLDSYTEADGDYFFARDSVRDLVVANLMASRLTVLYGPSGVGKSSLLQAGVLRLLRRTSEGAFSYLAVNESVIVYFSSWRNDPLAELGAALLRAVPNLQAVTDLVAAQPSLSLELIREVTNRLGADVYLLLDQFEELALYQTGEKGRVFDSELGRIITAPGLPVSVLLGVRDDALAKLDRLKAYVPGLFDISLRLDHLTQSEAREAIEQPLVRYNSSVPADRQVRIEPQLVAELLTQLRMGSVQVGDSGKGVVGGSDSIETPFMQLVMTRLWAAEAEQGSRVLRVDTLHRLGDAEQIVRTHLDAVMAGLTEEQRETAASIFRYLVTPSGMKISHTAEDLADYIGSDEPARVQDTLEELASSQERVLRPVAPPVDSDEPPRYEIFHDVMAPAVLDWRRRYNQIGEEQALVKAKLDAEELQRSTRRRLRRSRMLSAALALLLVVTGGSLWWALQSSANARRSEAKARSNEAKAQQQALMAEYQANLRSDPAASLHAALQAWHTQATPEAEAAVRIALDADTERRELKPDTGLLASSEFSPDGRRVLTAGAKGIATLFDAETKHIVRTFGPPGIETPPGLLRASFSPKGEFVLTLTVDGSVHVYDTASGRDFGELPAAVEDASWATLHGRPVVLVSPPEKPARLWDPQRRVELVTYGSNASTDAVASRDGRYVATVGEDGAVAVWATESGRLLRRSTSMGYYVLSPKFAAEQSGRILVQATETLNSWHVVLWDWRKGTKSSHWLSSSSRALGGDVAVSPDGRLIAVPLDKEAEVFDAQTGELLGATAEQPDWINAVAFSPDGHWLATAGADGKALIWIVDQINNRPTAELLGHHAGVSDVRFDPGNSQRVVTAGQDGTARTWELTPRTALAGQGSWILDVDLSSKGRRLVAAEDTGDVRVYEQTGDSSRWTKVASTRLGGYGLLHSARFTPDGTKVVLAREYSTAPSVWTWRSSDLPVTLASGDTWVTRLAVSTDGRFVAAGDDENGVTLWDLATGKIEPPRLIGGSTHESIFDVVYIPGTNLLAAASSDGTIRIWDPALPEAPRHTLGKVGDARVRSLDVSTDGRHLVSVAEDHAIRVWSMSSNEPEKLLAGPPSTNSDVAFSLDGGLVALASGDAAVHVWRWRDDQKLAVLHRHGDLVNSVLFTPDGQIVSASDDGSVAVAPCTTCGPFEQVLEMAEQRDASR